MVRRPGVSRPERNNGRKVVGPDFPDVQISHDIVCIGFDHRAYELAGRIACAAVEQNIARVTDKLIRPPRDQNRTDDAR